MATMKRPQILFLNIGWMKRYAGPAPDDPTRGNFGWLKQDVTRRHGHECCNFIPASGRCWGNHSGGVGTDIKKLGAQRGARSVEGVLVVWFARDPRADKAVIVGWYENATVYPQFQEPVNGKGHYLGKDRIWYKATARADDCLLLPVNDRSFSIPSCGEIDGGYGRSPNWYGLGDEFLDNVWGYIRSVRAGKGRNPKATAIPPRNDDHELRRQVEETAIRIATEFFESPVGGSRSVESVELQAKGWDLEAKGDDGILLVEVKGLSGSIPVAELTPNEYAKMKKYRKHWVMFIVTDCLAKPPKIYDFRYMHDANRWETSEGHILDVLPKTGAIVKVQT